MVLLKLDVRTHIHCKHQFQKENKRIEKTRPSRPIRCDAWIVERIRYPPNRPTDRASNRGALSHLKEHSNNKKKTRVRVVTCKNMRKDTVTHNLQSPLVWASFLFPPFRLFIKSPFLSSAYAKPKDKCLDLRSTPLFAASTFCLSTPLSTWFCLPWTCLSVRPSVRTNFVTSGYIQNKF